MTRSSDGPLKFISAAAFSASHPVIIIIFWPTRPNIGHLKACDLIVPPDRTVVHHKRVSVFLGRTRFCDRADEAAVRAGSTQPVTLPLLFRPGTLDNRIKPV